MPRFATPLTPSSQDAVGFIIRVGDAAVGLTQGGMSRSPKAVDERARAGVAVVGLVALIPCGAFACAGFAAVDDGTQLGWILIVAGVAGAVATIMLMEATAEVFHLVLYRYAVSGEAVAGFTVDELAHATVKRGEKRARVRATLRRILRR